MNQARFYSDLNSNLKKLPSLNLGVLECIKEAWSFTPDSLSNLFPQSLCGQLKSLATISSLLSSTLRRFSLSITKIHPHLRLCYSWMKPSLSSNVAISLCCSLIFINSHAPAFNSKGYQRSDAEHTWKRMLLTGHNLPRTGCSWELGQADCIFHFSCSLYIKLWTFKLKPKWLYPKIFQKWIMEKSKNNGWIKDRPFLGKQDTIYSL